MGSAFWFLMWRSARNRLIRQMNRLREPRYVIALIVGFAYLWFFLFQPRPAPRGSNQYLVSLVPLLGSIGLFVAVVRWWVFGGDRRALSFTPAEIQFLFPAPISRRALIRWKLLRWQILIAINTIIWILLARKTRPPIPLYFYIISIWAVFSTLSLHRLGAALARAGVGTHWRTGLRRQAIPITLAIAATAGLLGVVASHWTALSQSCCRAEFWPLLENVFREPVVIAVLYPFRLLMASLGAVTVDQWARTIGPALGLLVLHYVWVMRSQIAFEEAAVRASATVAQRLARRKGEKQVAGRAGTTRRFLRLAPTGWPGTAILWKNLIAVTRGAFSRSLVIGVVILVLAFGGVVSSEEQKGLAGTIGTAALAMAGFLTLLGPNWVRNDLRQDLTYLGLLRSYPLRGRTIVLAEIAASTLTLTAVQYVLLVAGYIGLAGTWRMSHSISPGLLLATALPVAFVVNAMGLGVQNAAALLFPAWVRLDALRPGGFETLGQNILTSLFTLSLTLAALTSPLVTAWLIWLVLQQNFGAWAPIPAAIAAIGLCILEFSLLIRWLGRVFERTEKIT